MPPIYGVGGEKKRKGVESYDDLIVFSISKFGGHVGADEGRGRWGGGRFESSSLKTAPNSMPDSIDCPHSDTEYDGAGVYSDSVKIQTLFSLYTTLAYEISFLLIGEYINIVYLQKRH